MITIKQITTFEEVLALAADQPEDPRNGHHRGSYLYRGLPNESFHLLTSLQRNCGKLSEVLEPRLLDNFCKYTAMEEGVDTSTVWKTMTLGQHHGLPTRLLDWTHSPFVGLHFATSDGNFADIDKNNCVIWRIDAEEIQGLLPDSFKKVLTSHKAGIFDVNMLEEAADSVEKYDEVMGEKAIAIMEPPSLDPRIVSQYAFFMVVPSGVKDIEEFLDKYTEKTVKYVISKDLKWRIRDFLDEANVSERTIYPGLDGICKVMARHYYVKDKE